MYRCLEICSKPTFVQVCEGKGKCQEDVKKKLRRVGNYISQSGVSLLHVISQLGMYDYLIYMRFSIWKMMSYWYGHVILLKMALINWICYTSYIVFIVSEMYLINCSSSPLPISFLFPTSALYCWLINKHTY